LHFESKNKERERERVQEREFKREREDQERRDNRRVINVKESHQRVFQGEGEDHRSSKKTVAREFV